MGMKLTAKRKIRSAADVGFGAKAHANTQLKMKNKEDQKARGFREWRMSGAL